MPDGKLYPGSSPDDPMDLVPKLSHTTDPADFGPSDTGPSAALVGPGLFLQGLGSFMKIQALQTYAAKTRQAANLSADSYLRAAADANERGKLREYQVTARGAAVIAEQRAQSSTGALDVNVGAQQATERSSQANLDFDRSVVRRNAALEAYGFRQQAQQQRQAGENEAEKADSQATGEFLSGIADFVKIAGPLLVGA